MTESFDVKRFIAQVLKGEDITVPSKATKPHLSELMVLLARITRKAHIRAKLARSELAEQPRWRAEHQALMLKQEHLQRNHQNLQDNYQALEDQRQKLGVRFESMVDDCSKQVSDLTMKLAAAQEKLALMVERNQIMNNALEVQGNLCRNNDALQKLGMVMKYEEEDETET